LGVFALLARFFNVLATIITLSVMAGCMQLVTVLSLMSGLEVDLRDKILNQKAHIRVSGVDGNRFTNYDELVADVAGLPAVAGASPYLEDEVMVRSGLNRQGAVLLGIQPERLTTVSNLEEIIEEGSYGTLADPASIPDFDPFAMGRDDTPWRLRHLDTERSAAEQGKNPPPRAIPEELKVGRSEDGTGEIGDGSDSETEGGGAGRLEAEGFGAGSGALPGLPGLEPQIQGQLPGLGTGKGLGLPGPPPPVPGVGAPPPEDEGWEDPAAVLGLEPGPSPKPLPRAVHGPAAKDPEPEEEGWEDPERVLGLPAGVEEVASGEPGGGAESGAGGENAAHTESGEAVVDPILIGRELAMELAVNVGARVQLITPVGRMTPAGRVPGQLATRVGGVFYSGMYEYDRKNVYLPLPVAQAFLRTGDRVTGIEVKLHDIERLEEGRLAVEGVISEHGRSDELTVETWQDLNRNLFSAMFLEKIAMFVALLFVILVASFGILASNLMSVLEKSKEIAIMKAMGAQDLLIRRVFVAEGLCMGLVGAVGGILMGLILCWALDRYGFPLNENVYYIEKLPVVVNPLEVTLVGIAALLIVWMSSLYPAWVASKMRPADGLRHAE
jgi:lipoprotein-releasing system permease protein